ncbi:virulence factor SrfC family protein [Zavarzinia sp.]|uniref:virulence factor SrfC family protein n=1 Tax=Zavarzinia sp. TaxID=2027920 RepID=UPI0035649F8E
MSSDQQAENEKLKALAARTAEVAGGALDWFQAHPGKLKQDEAALRRDFRRYATGARKLAAAAVRPMCVSVFGPSQAGKSYLISALARKGTDRLMAVFEDRTLDFVAELNPEGGQEATGVVTRFTMRRQAGPAGKPVALRLLSQTDVVKIIGNAYYSDFNLEDEEPPAPQQLGELFARLEPRASSTAADPLTADDVFDLQEYFEKYFKPQAGIRALSASFWARAADLAPRLSLVDRAELFAAIWNFIPELTRLYLRLAQGLEKLGHAGEAWVGIEALVPRETSIIDVRTLGDLGKEGAGETLTLVTREGRKADLARAEVTALIAELTIVMRDQPWPFFDHTDLLDFPGARSRENFPDPRGFIRQVGALRSVYLRGKVAYLFERYCAERELTAMLLCIGPSNQEVRTLPAMVKDWIDATHGATPEERQRQENALFLVLTKFDQEFEEKAGQAASTEGRWTIRLNASLLDFFGKAHDWPKAWTPGNAFDNTYWLRNPNFVAKHILDYDAEGNEVGIRASEAVRIANAKADYLANDAVRGHFRDAEKAWDEAFRLNDGGISYLAASLDPVCNPAIKRRQIEEQLRSLRRAMAERLARYYVSGDLSIELEKRRAAARACGRRLVACAGDQKFGVLLRALHVRPEALVDLFYRVEANDPGEKEAVDDGGTALGRRPDAKSMMDALFGDGPVAEAPAPLPQRARDQAERFADAALEHWMEQIHALADNGPLRDGLGLDAQSAATLAEELGIGARRLDLAERIAADVRRIASYRAKMGEAAAKPVAVAETAINSYVNRLGYDRQPLAARPVNRSSGKAIFTPPPPAGPYPKLAEEPAAYDQAFYVDWITGFFAFTDDNVSFKDGEAVDVEANARLGGLIQALD